MEVRRRSGSTSRSARLPLGLDGRGLRLRRTVALGLPRSRHLSHQAGRRRRPDRGPHACGHGDARSHHRRPCRREPGHHRPRGVRTPDRRGLVRPAVGQPEPAPARVRRHHAKGLRPRTAHLRRQGVHAPLQRTRCRRTGQGAAIDPPPRGRDRDLAGRWWTEEHRIGRRDRRRVSPDGVGQRTGGRPTGRPSRPASPSEVVVPHASRSSAASVSSSRTT